MEGYRALRCLGTGRLGATYLAEDERRGRQAAVKLLGGGHVPEIGVLRRHFDALRALELPELILPYEVAPGAAGGVALVMELVHGGSLVQTLAGPEGAAAPLSAVVDLLDALGEAHAHGQVHGDLKPSSVLLQIGEDGSMGVRVTDFGLAALLGYPDRAGLGAQDARGTDAQAAAARLPQPRPEHDLFAICGLLYELFAGHAAFDWRTPSPLAAERRAQVPHLVPRADLDVPDEVVDIVMTGLGPPPRWNDAESLRSALEAQIDAMQSRSSEAPPSSIPVPSLRGVPSSGTRDDRTFERLAEVVARLRDAETLPELLRLVPKGASRLLSGTHAQLCELDPENPGELRARHGAQVEIDATTLRALRALALDPAQARLVPARSLGHPLAAEHDWVVVTSVSEPERPAFIWVAGSARAEGAARQGLAALPLFCQVATSTWSATRLRSDLALERHRLHVALDIAAGGALLVDDDGRVSAANPAASELLRLSGSALMGHRLDQAPGLEQLSRALRRPRDTDGEVVGLPGGRARLRVRLYDGGVAVALEPLGETARPLRRPHAARHTFADLAGSDPALQRALADARAAARSAVSVLVRGESGTGKEMVAQAIHNASQRHREPFVGINVAAIPSELLESELFGYEQGAFTGARSGGLPGKFELAAGGTLLLDEIGDMDLAMQAKLLRVLEERVVQRLGSTKQVGVDVRIIATTHRDLEQGVRDGTFRLDLFHRIRVVEVRLPPLRERPGDIPALLAHFAGVAASRAGRATVSFAPEVLADLCAYAWPGNVRELANLVEGLASLASDDSAHVDRTPAHIRRALTVRPSRRPAADGSDAAPGSSPPPRIRPLREVERELYTQALAHFDGNVRKAAEALGVARGTFYNKMARWGLTGHE